MAETVERHCRRLDKESLATFVYELYRHDGWTVTPGHADGWFRLREEAGTTARLVYVHADYLTEPLVNDLLARERPVTVVCPQAEGTLAETLSRADGVTLVDAAALAERAAEAYPDVSLGEFEYHTLPGFVPFRRRLEALPPQRVAAAVSAVSAALITTSLMVTPLVPLVCLAAGLCVLAVAAELDIRWAPTSVRAVAVFSLIGVGVAVVTLALGHGLVFSALRRSAYTPPVVTVVTGVAVAIGTYVVTEPIHKRLLGL